MRTDQSHNLERLTNAHAPVLKYIFGTFSEEAPMTRYAMKSEDGPEARN